ncbi:MAG: 50S ribosomal protein L3 N(5)-glutamine methyltransferase [Xanthomonadales bacterium]|nr:50S ribosomal protein L3 N(5)-glutamine methyltransferase [Xanthomonadales bacterium]MCE7930055.1 50S ribosomal protein L3 N(5)-glutamine methyltransferase [Xanthomonadales bacterium PRO6]
MRTSAQSSTGCRALTDVLQSVCDFIRYATSRFNAAGLVYAQGFDSALDEASYLVLTTLHLPHDLPPAYASAVLLAEERALLLERIRRRVDERVPVAYLTGEAWFAGMAFKVTPDVLIPRSPIAELVERGFEPWVAGRTPGRVLDLCCGSGCIGIAIAAHLADAQVDLVDLSDAALELARSNAADHGVGDRVEILKSDGLRGLGGRRYDLIVANPPYVGESEYAALPPEFAHEPRLALVSGEDGLDLPLQILAGAAAHLEEYGLLVLEVGASEQALVECLPEVPFTWVEFERGGSGVAVLDREALLAHAADFGDALAARGLAP